MVTKRIKLLFSFYMFARMIKGHYKKQNEDIMLQVAILNLLSENKYTVSSLAQKLFIKISGISEKISELEKQGLIQKSKSDDGRETALVLTEKGSSVLHEFINRMDTHCTGITHNLNDQDIDKGIELLEKMNHFHDET